MVGNDFGSDHSRGCELPLFDSSLNLAVDLPSQQEHEAAQIEPGQKNNHGAERTIACGVARKDMYVHTKTERGQEPAQNADRRTWREPVPADGLESGAEIIDEREEQRKKG